MIIPIRCFTCGKTIGDKYDWYDEEVQLLIKQTNGETAEGKAVKKPTKKEAAEQEKLSESLKYFDEVKTGAILDKVGLTRYCCRRHMLGHVDMMKVI